MESDIEIQCPECKAFYTVPYQLRGDTGTCRACGTRFKVEPAGSKGFGKSAIGKGIAAVKNIFAGGGKKMSEKATV